MNHENEVKVIYEPWQTDMNTTSFHTPYTTTTKTKHCLMNHKKVTSRSDDICQFNMYTLQS